MRKSNDDIRKALEDNNMAQWRLADLLGVSEGTLGRKLRHELSDEEKQKIIKIIEKGEKNDWRKKCFYKPFL